MLRLTSEQEKIRTAVIKYMKEAYHASGNTRVPSLRGEICQYVTKTLEIPCYPDKIQPCFPPELDGSGPLMKRICSASGVPYPRERVDLAKNAMIVKKEKAVSLKVQGTPKPASHLEKIRRSLEVEKAQPGIRIDEAKQLVEEIKILISDPSKEVREPILQTIARSLPEITRVGWRFSIDFHTLLNTNRELKRMEKEGIDNSPKILERWRRLSHTGRKAFKDLSEEAETQRKDANTYVLDLRRQKKNYLQAVRRLEKTEKQLEEKIETKTKFVEENNKLTEENNRLKEENEKTKKEKRELETNLSQLEDTISTRKKELERVQAPLERFNKLVEDTTKDFAEARRIKLEQAQKIMKEMFDSNKPNTEEPKKHLDTLTGKH